jgi:hypothetical protein
MAILAARPILLVRQDNHGSVPEPLTKYERAQLNRGNGPS